MGPLCDDDAEKKPIKSDTTFDFIESETQAFDSQFSPSSLIVEELEAKDADELQFLQSTVPFDDTLPFEEAFETQVVDLCGETQVVNLGGETQEVNLGGETQEVNLGGETQILDTQLLDECHNSDGEETDRTEVLDDTEELSSSDDDSMERVENCSVDPQNTLHGTVCKEFDRGFKEKVDALGNEQHSSELHLSTATPLDQDNSEPKTGSVQGGFTSVRTASLRASGLAARRKASMGTNQYLKEHIAADNEVSLINNSSILGEEVDQDYVLGQYDDQTKLRNENKFRVGSSTVRKLFTEETILVNEVSELPQLSYIDSQEPGDLSQANALDFVDKFLETSLTDFNQEFDLGKSISEKSKHVSSAKGTQNLAKRANHRERVGEGGIYDWDDSREDEGGGEFFSRKKDAFFTNGSGKVSESGEKGKWLTRKKHSVLVRSKAKLVNLEATEIKSGKNLIKEFDEQVNLDSSNGMEVVDNDKDVGDMMNARFDTQMAAEAMEDLLYGVEGSLEEETINRAHSKENFLQNGASSSSFGIISRPSEQKRRVSSKLSKESSVSCKNKSKSAKKKPDGDLAKPQTRRDKKANPEQHFNTDVSEDLIKVPSKVKQGKEERGLEEQLKSCTPIACRTRQRRATKNQSKKVGNTKNKIGERNDLKEKERRKRSSTEVDDCEVSNAKEKISKLGSKQSVEPENVKLTEHEQPEPKLIDELRYPKRRRTQRKGSSKQAIGQEANGQSISRVKWLKTNDISNCTNLGIARQTRSSSHAGSVNTSLEASPTDRCKSFTTACVTPVNCITPVNAASPICMGDEYLKQSCRKNLAKSSLMKEINSLVASGPEPISEVKDSRRRRDMGNVRVLFSHHLDENIIKQQKKILARLGASVASSISDATHFITNKFVRTRNMLEAIAFGKPVVTHLWLESCGQASCSIDEKNYILRDAKKEKEFGFSLPVSLAHASQRPLLQGQKVFITPNTKPAKEILTSLVKAIQGMAVERLGRSAMKDDKIPDDLLVLSCEEDYSICVPFLEKGAAVYSSELLLNGIVTQKLEYERHRLFADHVKRTRSTIWVKKDSNQFLPVNRCK